MSLTITIDGNHHQSNGDLGTWLNSSRQQLIAANTIEIRSRKRYITGPILSTFFNNLMELPNCTDLDCEQN